VKVTTECSKCGGGTGQEHACTCAVNRLESAKIEVTEKMRQAVCEAIAEALGDAYDCTRVWSAWGCGTMGPDDFSLVAEDDYRLAEIADAAIKILTA